VTYTVLIGNADAHGKNLAFLHSDPERIRLAPLYDTVPTALWPRLRREAALSIGAQVLLPDVTMDDIVREARLWRHPEDRARQAAVSTIEAVTRAIEAEEIPPTSDVAEFVRGRAVELMARA
jgi:serine/threonine-protein kinase HipA